MLCEVYGEECLSRARVFEWHKRFCSGREDVEDDDRSGRPTTSSTNENVEKIDKIIRQDRRLSIRAVTEMVNIDRESVRKILVENLNIKKVCAKMVPKNLTIDQKFNRKEICSDTLKIIKDDPSFINNIITCDKTWIFTYDPETKRQSMHWRTPTSPRMKKARMSKSKFKAMLIVFFDIKGIIFVEWVPCGKQSINIIIKRIETCLSEAYKISIEKHNETIKNNRYVVSRLIDATCYLAKQELPFRGHDEQITSTNRGNYVELINLMETLDLKLSGHLSTATVFSGLSGDIQNDLIQSISNVLMKRVTLEIKNVDFVSIIMDETTDVVSKSQLSIIFRYITHEGVQERFLGFVDVSQDRSAKCLAEYTFNILQGYNCENKLIAQTYDGAAVMSGQHNGLQALVRLKCKNAMFLHCYAHKLNLILKQSVDHIKECKVFFLTLSGLSSFFSKSTKRIYALEQEVKKKFPSVAPTRWNYNSRLVEMMSEYKQEVLNLMGTIIENGEKWDSETLSCARGFFQTIQDFDFNFFLLIFGDILPQATILFNILQTKIFDVTYCNTKILDFVNHLKNIRNNFDQIWSKSEQYSNTEMPLRSKRLRITEVSEDKKTNYRRLFFEIIDVLITKINERFSEISKLQFFSLLDFSKFDQFVNQFPTSSMDSLKNSYGEYFDFSILKSELTIVYSSTEFHKRNINELWLYLKSTELSESLPQVTKLSSLILTIPATSAGAERSFSTLKRIHTYLRNSQSQNRLSALSILSIEKQLLTQIQKENSFYDEVIEDYSKKPRRINLCFK
ncbi:hypothetical protein QTP88_009004 [Uroleucon formosanum]